MKGISFFIGFILLLSSFNAIDNFEYTSGLVQATLGLLLIFRLGNENQNKN